MGVGHFSQTFSIFYMLNSKIHISEKGTCPMKNNFLKMVRGLKLLSSPWKNSIFSETFLLLCLWAIKNLSEVLPQSHLLFTVHALVCDRLNHAHLTKLYTTDQTMRNTQLKCHSNRRLKLSQLKVKVTVLGQRSENTATCSQLVRCFFMN